LGLFPDGPRRIKRAKATCTQLADGLHGSYSARPTISVHVGCIKGEEKECGKQLGAECK